MVDGGDESGNLRSQALAEVLEVARIGRCSDQLVNDGQEIVEGGDGCQGRCVVGSPVTARDGEQKGGVYDVEGDLAIVQGGGETAVGTPCNPRGAGSVSIEIEDALGVLLARGERHGAHVLVFSAAAWPRSLGRVWAAKTSK